MHNITTKTTIIAALAMCLPVMNTFAAMEKQRLADDQLLAQLDTTGAARQRSNHMLVPITKFTLGMSAAIAVTGLAGAAAAELSNPVLAAAAKPLIVRPIGALVTKSIIQDIFKRQSQCQQNFQRSATQLTADSLVSQYDNYPGQAALEKKAARIAQRKAAECDNDCKIS